MLQVPGRGSNHETQRAGRRWEKAVFKSHKIKQKGGKLLRPLKISLKCGTVRAEELGLSLHPTSELELSLHPTSELGTSLHPTSTPATSVPTGKGLVSCASRDGLYSIPDTSFMRTGPRVAAGVEAEHSWL